jgi:hypothetical protein
VSEYLGVQSDVSGEAFSFDANPIVTEFVIASFRKWIAGGITPYRRSSQKSAQDHLHLARNETCLAFFCKLLPKFAVGVCFSVKGLRNSFRSLHFAEKENFHPKVTAIWPKII